MAGLDKVLLTLLFLNAVNLLLGNFFQNGDCLCLTLSKNGQIKTLCCVHLSGEYYSFFDLIYQRYRALTFL